MVFITAEIGTNHLGDIKIVKQLINVAKAADCDAIKFQKKSVNKIYSEEFLNSPLESPWGTTTREQKFGLEFDKKEYDEINSYTKEKGIEWFASAWDEKSLDFLDKYKPKNQKVASAMITNIKFLHQVASRKIHTYISTGMTTQEMISEAVQIFKKNNCEFTLMHSVSTYPAKDEDLNLNIIHTLKKRYNCEVGYSGHEPSVSPSLVACALGASSLERHITIDRSSYGSDQSASLEENGLSQLINAVRKVKFILGNGEKIFLEEEKKVAKKLIKIVTNKRGSINNTYYL